MNRTLYKAVVVGLFLTIMGVVMGITSPGLSDTDLGIVGNQLHLPVVFSTFGLYAIVILRLIFAPARYRRTVGSILYVLPLCVFCLLSASWSSDSGLTIRRAVALILTMIVSWIIGTDFRLREIGRMLATASAIHLLLCCVLYVAARHYLFAPEDPTSLKGLTTHKNIFGFEEALAVLTFLFIPLGRFRAFALPLAAISFGLLLWSHSTGALIALIGGLVAWPLTQVFRLKPRERLPVIAVTLMMVTGCAIALGSVSDKLPALFSKDSTLTGRTQLWTLVRVAIEQRLWFGYGFDSFWRGLQGDSLSIIRGVGWLVPTAHNGYLDLMLSIGTVGALLFLPILIQACSSAINVVAAGKNRERFFPVVVLVALLIYNLNESALLTRSGLPLFFVVVMTISLKTHRDMSSRTLEKPVVRLGLPYIFPLPN